MIQQQEEQKLCPCMEGMSFSCTQTHLAGSLWEGEVSAKICLHCKQYWLHRHHELSVHDDDGECYAGPISAQVLETVPEDYENILV